MPKVSTNSGLVMVVEDEAMIRMLLVDELEDAGFAVVEASSADDAVDYLETHFEVEIVVTDIQMPGATDGLGMAAWMYKNRPALPIIITSGFATLGSVNEVNPAIIRVIDKPYKAFEVANILPGRY